ncbi:MAG: hypothetical protein ACSHX3_15495 [Litorimonas sp.]
MRQLFFAFTLLGASALVAQEDVFLFMPAGGRTILTTVLQADPGIADMLTDTRSSQEWQERLADPTLTAASALDDWQRKTLADYLAYSGPITDTAQLPWDGRDMTLERCQSCHIVTVVVTQSRTREAWLGTMNKPSHIEVPLSKGERLQLADYLVVNGGLPIDAIPPELRAGGASY